MKDFFISYSHLDEKWAEWIAWEIEDLNFDVIMQRWDFQPGSNFVLEMHSAASSARKVILILSDSFLESDFTAPEWSAFFSRDPRGSERLILPIRVEDCHPRGLLAQIVYLDLYGKNQTECRSLLRQTLAGLDGRNKPNKQAPFPGTNVPKDNISPTFPTKSKRPKLKDKASLEISKSIVDSIIGGHEYPFIRSRTTGRAFLTSTLGRFLKTAKSALDANGECFANTQSLIVVDVDGMSGINTRYGLDVGDRVLDVIFLLCAELPNKTVGGRLGDDTVFVLFRNLEKNQLEEIASSLVKKISKFSWSSIEKDLWVTCSCGIAMLGPKESSDDFITRAVEAQISARKEGGNSVKAACPATDKNWRGIAS